MFRFVIIKNYVSQSERAKKGAKLNSSSDSASNIRQIKEEMDSLAEEQINVLRAATYLGMTLHEAKQYDDRRTQITRLLQQLESAQATRSSQPSQRSSRTTIAR